MTLYKELCYGDTLGTVRSVQFSVMSAEAITEQSVVEVVKPDTFERNEPTVGGLFDPRMGVIDHGSVCVTCEQRNNFCPGHFGHIVMAKPVYHAQFFNMVRGVLRCVCVKCSSLLVDAPELKKGSRQKRWELVSAAAAKAKACPVCGTRKVGVVKDGILKIVFETKRTAAATGTVAEVVREERSAEDVLRILKRISQHDAEAMGFAKDSRPEHLVCTVLPVPPPSVRPSVRTDGGQRSEDDLTHKLSMIVKYNNKLKAMVEKGVAKDQVDVNTMLLQYEVATFVDNTMPGIPLSQQRTGRPIRSVVERLRGKEGRIRGNLMGKRVDFSARSVITPDPNISIDELGVPVKIAMNLTFPEVVNAYNIDELRRLVRAGPDVYPGAKFVRKTAENRTVRVKDLPDIALEVGDVVDRHMRDGDWVLFNRQPSLHRSSMMAHKVKVMPFNTFRLNVMVTPSFNADFDGDEMNAHLPQSYQTREELIQLAAVPTQIISPRESKPIVSVVQDIVLGLYRMTKPYRYIDERLFMNLTAANPRWTGGMPAPQTIDGKRKAWSGHQALSTIMPDNVNMRRGDADEDGGDNVVVIENGVVVRGCFDKDVYQARTYGIVHSVYNECGSEAAKDLLDNTQRMICTWLVHNGFSVGISDLAVSDATIGHFGRTIAEMKDRVYEIIGGVHNGRYENKSTKSNREDFEKRVNDILNQAVTEVGKTVSLQISDDNRMINMIKSKSKGNTINVSQMIGCVGQQNIDGKRIPYGFDSRTLPHYTKFDDGPEARGFVKSSFIRGLTPQEFFFAAMGGREGLIDTAVNTSETGYLQRKLIKAMEDCRVGFDYTVRNANGAIIQFLYGEDGMDASKVESHPVPLVGVADPRRHYHTDLVAAVPSTPGLGPKLKRHVEQLLADKAFLATRMFEGRMETSVMYPVSIVRTLNIAKGRLKTQVAAPVPAKARAKATKAAADQVTAEYILDRIAELAEELRVSADENKLFGMLLRMHLSPRVVMLDCGIRSKETFDWVVDQVRTKFYASLASPAEMVGVIAAQSIGEPATQLTLNSVDWRTELLLSVDGVLRRVEIGNFVDECVSISEEKDLEAHGNRTTLAWINRPGMPVVKVLSPDEDGKVAWQVVEAVTQHPPINEDGSRTLIKVTTATGREVIATKAKSFLIRKGNKLVASRGDELRVDDHLPVSEILPLPREATGVSSYGAMPLNEEFGSFMGAYAAGGCCVEHAVLVANLDATYIDKIRDFCDAYSIEYHMGESNTIRMHSPALAQLVLEACGTGAANKRVPVELFGAPAEFKKAFIDAYFSRGACVSSASRGLLEDISNLLVGFDIRTSVRPTSQVATGYVLDMDAANSRKFAQFAQRIEAEQERTVPRPEKDDVVPGVNLDAAAADVLMSKSAMRSMLADDATPEGSKGILRAALDQDVFYDKIVKIEEVESPHEFVYDLTVENTRTFQTYHGLGCYDTFHLAGVSAASKTVRGVPRLKELLSVSKNMKTPIMRVHFKPEDKASSNACLEVMNKLQTVRLRDIARRSKILYDPNNRYVDPATGRPDKEIVDIDRMFDDGDGDGAGCDDSPWVLRIELDNAALRRYNLDMIRIKHHIQKRSDVACAASDSNGEHLLLRVKIVDSARGASKKSASDVLSELKALESYLLESFVLQGVPGLEKFTLAQEKSKRYDETTQTYEDAAEWVAFTEGTNLARMLGHPRIDSTRLYTNNVREALEVLGVEAARQTMYIEIQEVLESITVNYRHLALLVDVQTNKGQLLSIDRHGINRGDIGPLAKCSFEETTDKLIKAGIFSEVDKINGVSANIMLGQVVPAGTGTVSLVMNNRLAALAPPKNANAAPVPAANADFCHEDAFDIAFELPAPRASAIAVV